MLTLIPEIEDGELVGYYDPHKRKEYKNLPKYNVSVDTNSAYIDGKVIDNLNAENERELKDLKLRESIQYIMDHPYPWRTKFAAQEAENNQHQQNLIEQVEEYNNGSFLGRMFGGR